MNLFVKHGLRFLLFVFVQVLVLNQIELGYGIQIMIYPLYILLLPVDLAIIPLMLIAFSTGLFIDVMSDTYGLHTSAMVAFAYARTLIFNLFAPRDGYDPLLETNVSNMGTGWFLKVFGLLLILHHFWFFMLEMFKLNEIGFVLRKTALSAPLSFLICILLQYLLLQKRAKNEI